MKKNSAKLTNAPVGRTLFNMTVPMVFGMVAMVAFNLVDTFFIGRLGTRELAALTFTFPVILAINSLTLGIGMGTTVAVARAIGRDDYKSARHLTTASLLLALFFAVLFTIAGKMTIGPVFLLLGAEEDMVLLISQYMSIWYWGAIFVVIPMVGNSAIRATGDTKTPSLIMLAAVCMNIILDPLLIFGLAGFPRMGLAGAALATISSRFTTMVLASWVLYHREKLISTVSLTKQIILRSWLKVLHVGLPVAASRLIAPVAIGFITNLIASYGHESIAAFGVGSRIDFFALAITIALASVISPFVGQNWTAGRKDRVKLGLKYANQFSLAYGLFMFLILSFSGGLIARLFSDNIEVVNLVRLYLWIVPAAYGLQSVAAIITSALNALKKSWISAGLSIGILFLVYLPSAWFGSRFFGLAGIFAAVIPAYAIGALASYLIIKNYLNKEHSQ